MYHMYNNRPVTTSVKIWCESKKQMSNFRDIFKHLMYCIGNH